MHKALKNICNSKTEKKGEKGSVKPVQKPVKTSAKLWEKTVQNYEKKQQCKNSALFGCRVVQWIAERHKSAPSSEIFVWTFAQTGQCYKNCGKSVNKLCRTLVQWIAGGDIKVHPAQKYWYKHLHIQGSEKVHAAGITLVNIAVNIWTHRTLQCSSVPCSEH